MCNKETNNFFFLRGEKTDALRCVLLTPRRCLRRVCYCRRPLSGSLLSYFLKYYLFKNILNCFLFIFKISILKKYKKTKKKAKIV